MYFRSICVALAATLLCVAIPGHTHDPPVRPFGRLSFPTSCKPNAQTQALAHYLILFHDTQPVAARGLKAARRYAAIAPDAAYALHVPSHIFTRIGDWNASAATNHLAVESALRANDSDGAWHASDYLVYANLQRARDAEARRDIETANKIFADKRRETAPYAKAAMAARFALERGAWREAMEVPAPVPGTVPSLFPYFDAIAWFARALGAARAGDVSAAETNAAQITALHGQMVSVMSVYRHGEVEVQKLAAYAWVALARNNPKEALGQMRAAADMEDKIGDHIDTPGRILPARELLGDMLMELKLPTAALKEYEASQAIQPNRFRGLYGAARAAEAAGNRAKAARYYKRLLATTKNADTNRPEIATARAFSITGGKRRSPDS